MPDIETTDWRVRARQLAAQLIPHTTSVQNVELLAEALKREHQLGFREAVRLKVLL